MKKLALLLSVSFVFFGASYSQENSEEKSLVEKLGLNESQTKEVNEILLYMNNNIKENRKIISESKDNLFSVKEEKKLLKLEIEDLKKQEPESTILQDKTKRMSELEYDENFHIKKIEELLEQNSRISADTKEKLTKILSKEQYLQFEKLEADMTKEIQRHKEQKEERSIIDEQVIKLKNELELTDDQAKKIKILIITKDNQIESVKKTYQKELKLILTKEQLEKLSAKEAEKKDE